MVALVGLVLVSVVCELTGSLNNRFYMDSSHLLVLLGIEWYALIGQIKMFKYPFKGMLF